MRPLENSDAIDWLTLQSSSSLSTPMQSTKQQQTAAKEKINKPPKQQKDNFLHREIILWSSNLKSSGMRFALWILRFITVALYHQRYNLTSYSLGSAPAAWNTTWNLLNSTLQDSFATQRGPSKGFVLKNHSLKFLGADPHPSHLTLGCKLI